MAVTRGYYESIANTVQTRTHFLIDMNLPTSGSDAVASPEYILSFAARYLNAARLTGESLRKWRDANRDVIHEADVPNACEVCEFRTPLPCGVWRHQGYRAISVFPEWDS
jgi:hypothetical protein